MNELPPNKGEFNSKFLVAEDTKNTQKKVREALDGLKIFTIRGTCPVVQKCFQNRGWVEKFEKKVQANCPNKLILMSRMIALNQVNFYWTSHKDLNDVTHRMIPNQMISKFAHTEFTSKAGLNLILQQSYWYNLNESFTIKFPRCYNLYMSEHYKSFVDDFKLTACISLLKLISEKNSEIVSSTGLVAISTLNYAIEKCRTYLDKKKHLDIDNNFKVPLTNLDWDHFYENYCGLLYDNQHLQLEPNVNFEIVIETVNGLLANLMQFSPQFHIDGCWNLWIIKPANKCRGNGIVLVRNLIEINKTLTSDKRSYVIQKYIEKPLLIFGTKFDIRQWFLVTNTHPLTIWIYKECYLRFSSQNFDLTNFHESIHLTNHAIQKKYKPHESRDRQLPEHHMWMLEEFLDYLKSINSLNNWEKIIYPGIVSNIVGTLLASQEAMDRRPNTFELFGADFMLDEYFHPWLIEINSGPDMNPTTSVTTQLCPECIEDVIKVVIDHRQDPKADTGKFQLVYKQMMEKTGPRTTGINLLVQGKKLDTKRMKLIRKSTKSNDGANDRFVYKETRKIPSLRSYEYKGAPIIYDLIDNIKKSKTFSSIDNQ